MKLNRKGYMTIEIILAAVVTFVIAFFLIDITMKLSSNTDDAYSDTVLITDKTLVTQNIKENLEKDICAYGNISSVSCTNSVCPVIPSVNGRCTITMSSGKKRVISNNGNLIEYKDTNGNVIYSKEIDNSLSGVCITSSNSNGYYNFKISGTNIFVDENYDINIFVYNRCE